MVTGLKAVIIRLLKSLKCNYCGNRLKKHYLSRILDNILLWYLKNSVVSEKRLPYDYKIGILRSTNIHMYIIL